MDNLGFSTVKNFITPEEVQRVSQYFWKKRDEGALILDTQCPGTKHLYGGNDEFLLEFQNSLLERACRHTGKELLPTYIFIRLYERGIELKRHTDRPACEFSFTVPLDMSDETPWPIYIEDQKEQMHYADLGLGDALMYSGFLPHWRHACPKNWQVQMFIHFVDAKGEHAGEARAEQTRGNSLFCWEFHARHGIPHEVCDHYVEEYRQYKSVVGMIGSDGYTLNPDVRDSIIRRPPHWTGIPAYLAAAGLEANRQIWQFDISNMVDVNFLEYRAGGKYTTHTDEVWMLNDRKKEQRKLSIIALLNDDFDGGDFYIETDKGKYIPEFSKGSIIVFPSFHLHGCMPVTEGTRYACVGWLMGAPFR